MPGPWDKYRSTTEPWKKYQSQNTVPSQPAGPQTHKDLQDTADSLVYSKMFNKPVSDAYQYHDTLQDSLGEMGVPKGNSVWQDMKVGLESSIFGLMERDKLPESLKDPTTFDSIVSGITEMGADVPFMLLGGVVGAAAGGVAGSEVPVVGNVVGAAVGGSMGTFAAPMAIRKALTEGISRGEVQSFGDLIDRLGNVAMEGTKGAAIGAGVYIAGAATLPALAAKPAVGLAMRRLQQVAALSTLPPLMEGRMPTAQDFAVNAAMFAALHYSAKAFGLADIAAPKVHREMMEAYKESGALPQDIVAEALADPRRDVDPIDRLNEMARQRTPEPTEETAAEPKDVTVTEPAPPGLRPAIKVGEDVTPAGEGEQHPDVIGRVEGASKAEEDGQLERGFVDRNENFHTRDEAKSWVRQNEPEVAKAWEKVTGDPNAPFHSEDYNEARQQATGIKNAAVDEQRAQRGLPPLERPMQVLDPDNWENSKEDVDSGRVDPLAIAASINKNPRGMSTEETNALNYYRAQLANQEKAALDAVERAREADDPIAEQKARAGKDEVQRKIDTIEEAVGRAGTEWSHTGTARKNMIAEDYSLTRLLQRARVASPNGQVAPEVEDRLSRLSSQLEEANKKLEEYQNKQAEQTGKETVEKIKRETAKTERKVARAEQRADLKIEFGNLTKQLDKLLVGRVSSNPFLDPEILGLLGKMARNRVESGLTRFEDVVDDIHGALTEIGYKVSKRDLGDAISGYGKTIEMSKEEIDVAMREVRRQGKLISALEDAESKVLPKRSGLQRDTASDRVRELQRQVKQAMRESGIDVRSAQTPEAQWKTALESVKTRLRNQINDLTQQIKTGEKIPKREGIAYDEEAKALQKTRDDLKETLKRVVGDPGKRQMTAEQRINMATKALEKTIAEHERRIADADLTPAQRRAGRPEGPELTALRDRLDGLRDTYREMKKAAEPKKTPEQMALARFKSYTTKRIADLERRIQTGDFTKEPQKKTVLDPEANELKLKVERLREQARFEVAKQERASWTPTEKFVHHFLKWRRAALLTGIRTFGRLGSSAMSRMGATPVEELTGGVLSQVPGISKVAERAPFEGKPSISAEAKALAEIFNPDTWGDTWRALKTGKTTLDELYGKKGHGRMPPEALDFIGQVHAAVKVLPKRAEFARRMEIGTQWAIDHNLDINDPRVQSALTAGAYQEAQRAIFMQDNVVSEAWNMALSYAHNHGAPGKTVEAVGRFMLPIVKVPTNIVAETLSYHPVSLAVQTVQLLRLLFNENKMGRSAMDNLTMHDFDNVMRGLKKGTVGLPLLFIGWSLRDKVSGYFSSKKDKQFERGTMKIAGVTIPEFLQESPALSTIQMGATMGHVWDYYHMKGMSGGLVAGAAHAGMGVVQRTPFIDVPGRLAQQTKTPEETGVFLGSLASSTLVPLGVQQVARWTDPLGDEGSKRKARTPGEAIELALPKLRQNVPVRFSVRRGGSFM